MSFLVGQRVRIEQWFPGGSTLVRGRGVIVKVGFHRVDLDNGTQWRRRDGYEWGSLSERGIGRACARRIVVEEER